MKDKILIVDDELLVVKALQRSLNDERFEIFQAQSGKAALEIMHKQKVKVVISDERMPEMGGADFLAIVREKYPATVRIMLTGHADITAIMKAVNGGEIYRFFVKPWDDVELGLAVRLAVGKYDLEEENRRLLSVIKHQAMEIKFMEKRYPGISRMEKNMAGSYVMPDMTDEDLAKIIEEYLK